MTDPIHPIAALARRFTIDWLDLADARVPPTIMTPGYRVHIGSADLTSLDEYVEQTMVQLGRYPGLILTVHQLVTDGEQLAITFTEHGASARHEGRAAAWRGVALFRISDDLLAENWTQEDYYARRRQLAHGSPDPVPFPAVAPWTTAPQPPDPSAEAAVRQWLATPVFDAVTVDDDSGLVVEPTSVEVDRLFSAGPFVALAATWKGRYVGGLDDVTAPGSDVPVGVCAVLEVHEGVVISGQLVTDRLGLRRTLLGAARR